MIESEQMGELAFEYHNKIQSNERKRRELMAENAKLLSIMKGGLYKAILGDDKGKWAGYLGQIEVMYSRSSVENMIQIYQRLCEGLNLNYDEISDIPKSRLLDLSNILCSGSQVEEWLNKARNLTNQDWTNEIREMKGLPTMEECSHKFQDYEICSICGLRHQKNENC
jgi:hypothetical protein